MCIRSNEIVLRMFLILTTNVVKCGTNVSTLNMLFGGIIFVFVFCFLFFLPLVVSISLIILYQNISVCLRLSKGITNALIVLFAP